MREIGGDSGRLREIAGEKKPLVDQHELVVHPRLRVFSLVASDHGRDAGSRQLEDPRAGREGLLRV